MNAYVQEKPDAFSLGKRMVRGGEFAIGFSVPPHEFYWGELPCFVMLNAHVIAQPGFTRVVKHMVL